ncbi:MAG: nickel pincer cofactor biosynthesis protein LarC [Dehalococcoidia bacterium]|nr:nickel pincer cofactor biosynthesis protein LarC [Dehalococcoidia bacterium]
MKTAYLHLLGGASGDMLLAALLDAGLPLVSLQAELAKLPVKGFTLTPGLAQRGGVHGTHLRVELGEHRHKKLTWRDFRRLVETSGLENEEKASALRVLGNLAAAERRAHHETDQDAEPDLCELGSLDTLLDVVGVVAGLKLLGVQRLTASLLPAGAGAIRSEHGPLPAFAPATAHLAAQANAPVAAPGALWGETVTPTGAALVTTLAEFRRPVLRLERVGYGLGTRDTPDHPNVVALWVGEEAAADAATASLVLLETNIDDMTPQLFGYVQEKLLALGALDVWFSPIQMKKNRPGTLLSALLPTALEARAVELLLTETSTLGVRTRPVQRHEAPRSSVSVQTSLGPVTMKVKEWNGRPVSAAPEYEECKAIAERLGLPLQQVMAVVSREAAAQLALAASQGRARPPDV